MTNPMTPTEQDKELLREQVHKLFGDHQADDGGYQSCYDGKWIDMTNEVCAVADFITADRKRVELEARLDELNNVRSMWTKPRIGDIKFGHWLHYRQKTLVDFAELKAQQEEV